MSLEKPPPRLNRIVAYLRVVTNEFLDAYMAGVFDSGGRIGVEVHKSESHRLGFQITPLVTVERAEEQVVHLIDDWAVEHGLRATLNKKQRQDNVTYIWKLQRREDVEYFLDVLEPYLLIQSEAADIIREKILPRLEAGDHRTKEGFIEVIGYVDEARSASLTGSKSRYTQDYFEDLWADEIET